MDNKCLRFVHVNARSLTTVSDIGARIDHIKQFFVTEKDCDIIACTETHLDDSVDENLIYLNGYSFFRRDRNRAGRWSGGVCKESNSCYKTDGIGK